MLLFPVCRLNIVDINSEIKMKNYFGANNYQEVQQISQDLCLFSCLFLKGHNWTESGKFVESLCYTVLEALCVYSIYVSVYAFLCLTTFS